MLASSESLCKAHEMFWLIEKVVGMLVMMILTGEVDVICKHT